MTLFKNSSSWLVNIIITLLFLLFINIAAFIQFYYALQIELSSKMFIVPNIVGLVFAYIMILARRYFLISKERIFYEKLAKTDLLTGVLNRYAFEIIYDIEYKRHQRTDEPYAMLMFDIDNFKTVNDTYGHPIGDQVLIELCDLIGQQLREMDTLCRWGGEEFVILLPHTSDIDLEPIAQKLLIQVRKHRFTIHKIQISISIGMVSNGMSIPTLNDMITHTDKALYLAKHAGKDCAKMAQIS